VSHLATVRTRVAGADDRHRRLVTQAAEPLVYGVAIFPGHCCEQHGRRVGEVLE
jgi:hypothetical protein